ncbi:MAG: 50S ribosomal protein L7ae-like protein [Firmicutes bacterium]|nr:50S ribosomal protein L7ae-like protein [Bacillota bacterium]
MPARLVNSQRVVGAKQTLKAVQAEQVELVYLARDADEHVTGPIRKECEIRGITIIEVDTMAELGKACNIDVGAAVASVVKSSIEI